MDVRPRCLLAGADLVRWSFDHLQSSRQPSCPTTGIAIAFRLSIFDDGYRGIVDPTRFAFQGLPPQVLRRRRELEHDVGPVTFEWSTDDRDGAMRSLRRWKSRRAPPRRLGPLQLPMDRPGRGPAVPHE